MQHDRQAGKIYFDSNEWRKLGQDPNLPTTLPDSAAHSLIGRIVRVTDELEASSAYVPDHDPMAISQGRDDAAQYRQLYGELVAIRNWTTALIQ